jgi:hypothetical protein
MLNEAYPNQVISYNLFNIFKYSIKKINALLPFLADLHTFEYVDDKIQNNLR